MFKNLEKMDIWGWNATHPLYHFHKRYIFCYIFRLSFGFFANHWLAKMIFWNQSLIASLLNDDMRNEILSDEYILTLGLIIWSAYNLILKTPHAIYRYMLSIFAKKRTKWAYTSLQNATKIGKLHMMKCCLYENITK